MPRKTDLRKEGVRKREEERRKSTRETALHLILSTVLVFTIYYLVVTKTAYGFLVLWSITAILGIVYVVMNRFFTRHGATMENLSSEMSYEEKVAFIAGREERKQASRPILFFLLPFLVAIMIDLLYLAFFVGK